MSRTSTREQEAIQTVATSDNVLNISSGLLSQPAGSFGIGAAYLRTQDQKDQDALKQKEFHDSICACQQGITIIVSTLLHLHPGVSTNSIQVLSFIMINDACSSTNGCLSRSTNRNVSHRWTTRHSERPEVFNPSNTSCGSCSRMEMRTYSPPPSTSMAAGLAHSFRVSRTYSKSQTPSSFSTYQKEKSLPTHPIEMTMNSLARASMLRHGSCICRSRLTLMCCRWILASGTWAGNVPAGVGS